MTEQTPIAVPNPTSAKGAVLYRMVMPHHTCPYGLKAKHLLKSHGYTIDDRHLTTREETDHFKAQHGVRTTPQVWIEDKRIGGYEDLRRHFGQSVAEPDAVSYTPVLAVFAAAGALAAAASVATHGTVLTVMAAEWFVSSTLR